MDQMVDEWAAVMPAQNVDCLHVVSRMLRIVRIFEQDRARVLSRIGLEPWSFDMLAVLRRRPGSQATAGELVAATLVTSGTMTARLKSLENRGWVARSPSSTDRRQVIVMLTIPGRELFDRVFTDVVSCQQRLIAGLGPDERDTLVGVFRKMLADLDTPT